MNPSRAFPLLAAPLMMAALPSCSVSVAKIKAQPGPIGVMAIQPANPTADAQVIGGGLIPQAISEATLSGFQNRVAKYEGHRKTFHSYAEEVAAKLRSQGVDARALKAYPSAKELDTNFTGSKFNNLPAEASGYPTLLVLNEHISTVRPTLAVVPVGGSSPQGTHTAYLYSASKGKLLNPVQLIRIHPGDWPAGKETDAAIFQGFDQVTKDSRQSFLNAMGM